MDDETFPPGVSITHIEVGFWNLVLFSFKLILAIFLAALPLAVLVIVALALYTLATSQ